MFWSVGPALAGQVTNTDSGRIHTTIAAAIQAAQAGDTLQVAAADYLEEVVIDRDLTLIGDPGATVIGPVGVPDVVVVLSGVNATIEGLVVLGSLHELEQRPVRIWSGAGDVTIRDSALVGLGPLAPGAVGGALWAEDFGTVTLEDSAVSGGTDADGGAIYAGSVFDSTLVLTRVTVESAQVGPTKAEAIGLDHVDLEVTESVFRSVAADAIFAVDSSITVTRSTFCDVDRAALAFGAAEVHTFTNNVFISPQDLQQFTITEGTWTIANNAFLGTSGLWADTSTITVVNNVFASSAVGVDPDAPLAPTYNWFYDVSSEIPLPADPSNHLAAGDPLFQAWSADEDCYDDVVVPQPIVSPLIDAGDPAVSDPDGSRSDLGPYGGPGADPLYHLDGDTDGLPYLYDCDDADPLWGGAATWFADCDADGFGDLESSVLACTPPEGCAWVAAPGDCDDLDGARRPGALDPCGDAVDQDCDGSDGAAVDRVAWFPDGDADGYGDGEADAVVGCAPVDGRIDDASDCDDTDPTVNPGAPEVCDGRDQDCDLRVDDGPPTLWYADADADGAGDPDMAVYDACPPNDGWIPVAGDCDDSDPDRIEDCVDKAAAEGCGCATRGRSTRSGPGPALAGWLALALAGRLRRRP